MCKFTKRFLNNDKKIFDFIEMVQDLTQIGEFCKANGWRVMMFTPSSPNMHIHFCCVPFAISVL